MTKELLKTVKFLREKINLRKETALIIKKLPKKVIQKIKVTSQKIIKKKPYLKKMKVFPIKVVKIRH